jgi:hypothetical protein
VIAALTSVAAAAAAAHLPLAAARPDAEDLPCSQAAKVIRLGTKTFATCAVFSPDGQFLVSGCADGFIEVSQLQSIFFAISFNDDIYCRGSFMMLFNSCNLFSPRYFLPCPYCTFHSTRAFTALSLARFTNTFLLFCFRCGIQTLANCAKTSSFRRKNRLLPSDLDLGTTLNPH